jgi:hypothetical protein
MNYPDKHIHKPTITNKLREDLIKFSKGFAKSSYLEIGFDRGFTMATLSPYFKSMYGVDISQDRYNEAIKLFAENEIKNAMVFCGNATRVPLNRYDVILIDAAHDYENVLFDTFTVLNKNINEKPFLIVYHDYGLVQAGGRQFCDEFFSDFMVPVGQEKDWNPLGGDTNGPEAMACAFDNKMKKKYLQLLQRKIKK